MQNETQQTEVITVEAVITYVRNHAADLKAEMLFQSQPAILLVDAHRDYLNSKTEKERNKNREWLIKMYTRYIETKQVQS